MSLANWPRELLDFMLFDFINHHADPRVERLAMGGDLVCGVICLLLGLLGFDQLFSFGWWGVLIIALTVFSDVLGVLFCMRFNARRKRINRG